MSNTKRTCFLLLEFLEQSILIQVILFLSLSEWSHMQWTSFCNSQIIIFFSFPYLCGITLGECIICFDSTENVYSLDCCHVVCVECWKRWINERISSQNLRVNCPGERCKKCVPSALISGLVDRDVYAKYRKSVRLSWIFSFFIPYF